MATNKSVVQQLVEGRVSGLVQQPSRVLKGFSDLNNITFVDSTVTSTRVIDQSSPFGRPALKLTIDASGGAGYTEILFASVGLKSFNAHVAWRLWIDNPTRVSQCVGFLGTASYAKFNQYTYSVFNSNEHNYGGICPLVLGPQSPYIVAANPTFVFGTDTLEATKLRVFVVAGVSTIVWIDAIEVVVPQRPVVCLTFDDNDDSMYDDALPVLEKYGLKATFFINTTGLGTGGALTNAEVQALAAAGNQVASHNQNNFRLQTLYSSGIINGTSTANQPSSYLSEYRAACATLEGLTGVSDDFSAHAWVQGGNDHNALQMLRSAGVRLARGTTAQSGSGGSATAGAFPYGSGLGNTARALPWIGMGSLSPIASVLTAIDAVNTYGSLVVLGFHTLAATSADSTTFSATDFAVLCQTLSRLQNEGALDVLSLKELAERLTACGLLDALPYGKPFDTAVRQIGHLASVNFNSTADQAITLYNGAQSWVITDIIATNVTVSLTTAAGGVYPSAAKGGTPIVAAAQTYSALTGTATQILRLTIADSTPTNTQVYFSLTTGQGSAATGDLFVFGYPV